MEQSGYRALVDLSFAGLGYCGFAQESRVLLKALYQLDTVEPTGLIFGRNDEVIHHRFDATAREGRNIENQARFLHALVDRHPRRPSLAPMRWYRRLQTAWRLTLSRRVDTDVLDSGVFWDAVWRSLLERSLCETDIDIARHCRMRLANLGGRMVSVRNQLGLPSLHLDTRDHDFAIFHDSQPVRVSPPTCKLIRYYDMIPGVRPDLVGSRQDIVGHFRGIRRCAGDSVFVCNSAPTRDDLLRAFPQLAERSVVIPHALADGYYPERQDSRLPGILRSRRAEPSALSRGVPDAAVSPGAMPPYLLITATIEPRKNHVTLIRAFERLIARRETDLRLVVVGRPGWKYDDALKAMQPLIEQGRLIHLVDVPTAELRLLYSHAEAMVYPSLYEGFGYGPLEAMACGTPAVVSDIAAHRWVYEDAARYFDPYRVDSLVEALEQLLFSESDDLRHRLVEAGARRTGRYSVKAVGGYWLALFDELRRQGITGNVKEARLAGVSLC